MKLRKPTSRTRATALAFLFLSLTSCSSLLAEQQLGAHLSCGRAYQDTLELCKSADNFETAYAPALYAHKVKITTLREAIANDAVTDTITDEEDEAFEALATAATQCETQLEEGETE